MQGTSLFYDVAQDTGLIRGTDNNRYYFSKNDCFGGIVPVQGQEVDFLAEGNTAKEIVVTGAASVSEARSSTEPLRPHPFDSPQHRQQAPAKFIYNLPGVIASVLLLVSLFIP